MNNSSIKSRYSLSTANLTSPIAESTLNGLSSGSRFNWGEGTISPRNRNNSNTSIDKSKSICKNSNGLPNKISMSPISRIDPRTYVDIHSNGLASRIVKYHDNSARLNRSQSMTSLYNKPGQFPVVHLKKCEQQYKAQKTKTLSMTRIAAPEKSVFHGNTLSSILRSGSIVGLQKSDEEISRENRPILHPPATENEMAPTRSVLEVLKEISRKRINSDELDGTELTKKQCKEQEQETTSIAGQRTQSKRQREITNSNSTYNTQISPEQQVIKKRMCNYNNDILSSLSSSMASVAKRKMCDMQSSKRLASDISSSFSNLEKTRNEKQPCIGDSEEQQSATNTKYATTLSSHPSAPIQNIVNCDEDITRNGVGVVTRRASEPILTNTKPKLTLFNKNYDEEPLVKNDQIEFKEDGDLRGIQFVKPKKSSSISSGGTLLMEKTKKSKLALMLSGLKGELDEEDEVDAVVSKKNEQKPAENATSIQQSSISNTVTSDILSSTTTTTTTTTASVALTAPITTNKPVVEDSANKPVATNTGFQLTSSTITSTNSTVKEIPTQNTAQNLTQVVTTTIPQLSNISTSKPTVGGFSFGLTNPTKTLTTTPTTSTLNLSGPPSTVSSATNSLTLTTSTSKPLVPDTNSNAVLKPYTLSTPTTQTPMSSAPSFSFGAPTTLTNTITSTTQPQAISTFGSPISKTNPATLSSASTVFGQSSGSSQPSFSFGSLTAAKITTTNILTTQTVTPAAVVSFGQPNSNTLPQPTTISTSTSSTVAFAFGAKPSTDASKSVFGNIAPSTQTPITSNTSFSFSTTKTTINPTNTSSAFTFGAGTPAPASNTAPTLFGAPAVAVVPAASVNSNPTNVFGSTPSLKPSNTFTFGTPAPSAAPAPTQNNTFSFSSSEKTTVVPAATNSVGGFSFNNPPVNFTPVPDFGTAVPAVADPKPVFNFGSSTTNNTNTDKPVVFGSSSNIFGTPAKPQSSAFTFGGGSSSNTGTSTPNLFGSAQASNNLIPSAATGSNSIFAAPTTAIAQPQQQSTTFNFGSSSNTIKPEANKPAGGFVFGSTSSIGSNVSKPTADMNKTFVFGDSTTTIKPVLPSATSNVFGGTSSTSNANGKTENKMFSFGAQPTGSNNSFAASSRQTVNQAPAFNFGATNNQPNIVAPAPNGNLFAPQQGQQLPDKRPIKKATRRLHKT